MSQSYCLHLWHLAMLDIQALMNEAGKESSNIEHSSKSYIGYLQALNRLDLVFTHIRQPQHRAAVGRALECCAGLVCEAWAALVASNDGVHVVNLIQGLGPAKQTPDDLEVSVPPSFRGPRKQQLAAYQAILKDAVATINDPTPESKNPADLPSIHREGPTGFLSGQIPHTPAPRTPPRPPRIFDSADTAATLIQSVWRLYRDRRIVAAMWCAEEGAQMSVPSGAPCTHSSTPLEASSKSRQERLQNEFDVSSRDAEDMVETQEGLAIRLEERARLAAVDPASARGTDNARGTAPLDHVTGVTPAHEEFRHDMRQVLVEWQAQWNTTGDALAMGAGSDPGSHPDVPELQGLPIPRRGSSVDALDVSLLLQDAKRKVQDRLRAGIREEAGRAAAQTATPAPPTMEKQSRVKKDAPASIKQKQTRQNGSIAPTSTAKKPIKDERSTGTPTLDGRDLPSLLTELATKGIAKESPPRYKGHTLASFLGECCFVGAPPPGTDAVQVAPVRKAKVGGKAANLPSQTSEPLLPYPDLSLAQVRQLVAVECALPLATPGVYANLQKRPSSVLLYGPAGSGKSMLGHLIAQDAGATLFDLSPRAIAGKSEGTDSAVMVRMVFAAAKRAAPSLVILDDVEKIFIRDKARAVSASKELPPVKAPSAAGIVEGEEDNAGPAATGEGGEQTPPEPPHRIRQPLMEEVSRLSPADGVLVVGTSREPHSCVGGDEIDFISFFQLLVKVPVPDDCSRRILLAAAAQTHGATWTRDSRMPAWRDLSTATHITRGYTAGQIQGMMDKAAMLWDAETGKGHNTPERLSLLDCLTYTASLYEKPSQTYLDALADWTARAHKVKRHESVGADVPASKAAAKARK